MRTISLAGCAIVVLCVVTPARALDPNRSLTQYLHRIWHVQQGLPHPSVYALRQTADGYLWLGTQAGLARFDGIKFTVVRERGGVSLENLWVTRIVEDKRHALWVGTKSSGLYRLTDAAAQRWTAAEGVPGAIDDLLLDRDGMLWVATPAGTFQFRNERFVPFTANGALTGVGVRALTQTADGRVWIAVAARKLYAWKDGVLEDHAPTKTDPTAQVTALVADDDDVWLGTTNGLLRRTVAGERVWTTADGPADDNVLCLLRAVDGGLWVGTKGGVCRIVGEEIENFGTRDGLSQNSVHAILQDREENMWVGTKHGLNQLADRRIIPFTVSEGLPTNDVGPVLRDRGDAIWIGTTGRGLVRYDGRRFHVTTSAEGLAGDTVHALARAKPEGIWVATERALQRLVDDRFVETFTGEEGLPEGVRCIFEDAAGVWVGTATGLAQLRKGRFESIDAPELRGKSILALGAYRRDKLIVATESDGVFLRGDDGFRPLPLGTKSPAVVDAIYADADGLIWLGTRGEGLKLFDGEHVVGFTLGDGLFDDDIYGIVGDDQDRLWMACGKGAFAVARTALRHYAAGLDKTPLRCEPFSPTEAQRTIECRPGIQPAVARTDDGKIWFTTIHGLIVVDTKNLTRRLPPIPVVVEETLADGRSLGAAHALRLPPGSGNLTFRYASLGFQSPARVTFRYRLEGFDDDWVDAGTRREAIYTNLPSGDYRFRVAATNVDGQTNESAESIALSIEPLWYRRPWFAPLCATLLCAAALAGYRLRVDAVRRRSAAIIDERGRIARELHDTLLQGFSGVTMEMQALGSRMPATSERDELRSIIDDAAVCLREARRSVAGLRDRDAPASDLAEKLATAAARIVADRAVRLKTRFTRSPIGLPTDVEYQLLRIAQEALSNAVKHASAKTIELTLESLRKTLVLTIVDDGIGFDPTQRDSAERFGLIGMRERAQQIGAEFQVRSAPERGTTVTIALPKSKTPSKPTSIAPSNPRGVPEERDA